MPSGTEVFDWTLADEWNVREAWVRGPDGGGSPTSTPTRCTWSATAHRCTRTSLDELRPHLHSLPEHPDWIPYRTSYYHRDWGFCLPHRDLEALRPGDYEVLVDATLAPGELVYGEVVLPGSTDEEVLISSHVCHPSLANDNLTGLAVATELVRRSPPGRRGATPTASSSRPAPSAP